METVNKQHEKANSAMGKKKAGRKVDEKLLFYIWVAQVDLIESVTFEQRCGRNLQHWSGEGELSKQREWPMPRLAWRV